MQNFVSQGDKAIIINPVDSAATAPSVKLGQRDRRQTGGRAAWQAAEREGPDRRARRHARHLRGERPGEGFEEGIGEFPGIKVVAQQSANFDRTDGLNVMINLYQAHPNIVGVFAANDEMALGAVKALGAKAGHQINVDIAQQPKLLGQLAVEAAAKAAEGGKVPANNAIPVKIATSANVTQFLSAS